MPDEPNEADQRLITYRTMFTGFRKTRMGRGTKETDLPKSPLAELFLSHAAERGFELETTSASPTSPRTYKFSDKGNSAKSVRVMLVPRRDGEVWLQVYEPVVTAQENDRVKATDYRPVGPRSYTIHTAGAAVITISAADMPHIIADAFEQVLKARESQTAKAGEPA